MAREQEHFGETVQGLFAPQPLRLLPPRPRMLVLQALEDALLGWEGEKH